MYLLKKLRRLDNDSLANLVIKFRIGYNNRNDNEEMVIEELLSKLIE